MGSSHEFDGGKLSRGAVSLAVTTVVHLAVGPVVWSVLVNVVQSSVKLKAPSGWVNSVDLSGGKFLVLVAIANKLGLEVVKGLEGVISPVIVSILIESAEWRLDELIMRIVVDINEVLDSETGVSKFWSLHKLHVSKSIAELHGDPVRSVIVSFVSNDRSSQDCLEEFLHFWHVSNSSGKSDWIHMFTVEVFTAWFVPISEDLSWNISQGKIRVIHGSNIGTEHLYPSPFAHTSQNTIVGIVVIWTNKLKFKSWCRSES